MKVTRTTALWLSLAADDNAASVTSPVTLRVGKRIVTRRRHWGELADVVVRKYARERAEWWREYARKADGT